MEGSNKKGDKAPTKTREEAPKPRQLSAQQREALKPLRDKVRKLEQQLEKESAQLQKIEQQLADPSLYEEVNKKKMAELLLKQGELKNRVAGIEEEWMMATEELEGAEGG